MLVGLLGGFAAAVVVHHFAVRPRLERLEGVIQDVPIRVERLEERISCLEGNIEGVDSRVDQFEHMYYIDSRRRQADYEALWYEVEGLRESVSRIPELRQKLDGILSRLEVAVELKTDNRYYR